MPDDIAVRQIMDGRVAHFKSLTKSPQAFVDTRLPGHERDIYNVIGPGVSEDPALLPAIADAQGQAPSKVTSARYLIRQLI